MNRKQLKKEYGYPDNQDWNWTVDGYVVNVELNGKHYDTIDIDGLVEDWIELQDEMINN